MDIKILVAMHKPAWHPSDSVYYPIHVGAGGKEPIEGIASDNTGENISPKNASFCELTGLYWAWKNLQCDYIGLCHYRRYFGHFILPNASVEKKKQSIFSQRDYESLLKKYDVILPTKWIHTRENVKEHYAKYHREMDLLHVRNVIMQLHPEYGASFDMVMDKHSQHVYNMFVMQKAKFDSYCEWLFSILFKVEQESDITNYDEYQARVYGFLAERLLDVWMLNQNLRTTEAHVVFLGEEHQSILKVIKEQIRLKIWNILKL